MCRDTPPVGYLQVAAVVNANFTQPDLTPQYLWQMGNVGDDSDWPPFVCLTSDERHAPVRQDAYGVQSFIFDMRRVPHRGFSRIEPSGRFYFIEAFADDLQPGQPPRRSLDFVNQTKASTRPNG
jgi:hypothetical protein